MVVVVVVVVVDVDVDVVVVVVGFLFASLSTNPFRESSPLAAKGLMPC